MVDSGSARFTIANGEGRRSPLVFVRTWAGSDDLARLAAAGDPEQPIVGIEPPDRREYAELNLVEDWVRHVREQLHGIPVEPPYRLAGWSFGGIVALELARGLHTETIPVASLDLIDSWGPRLHPRTAVDRAIFHLTQLQSLTSEQRRTYLAVAARQILSRTLGLAAARTRVLGSRVDDRRSEPVALAPSRRAIRIAWLKYAPAPYPGRVTLHSCERSIARHDGDPSLGWSRWLIGGFDVVRMPGDHETMWDPEHVAALARDLAGPAVGGAEDVVLEPRVRRAVHAALRDR